MTDTPLPSPPRAGSDRLSLPICIGLLLVLMFVIGVRLRLESFPLERDEGEYAYSGQLIRQGVAPYTLAYNMKLPGTYLAYAALMSVFGETTEGIHRGLLIVNLACILLVFSIGRRLIDAKAGLFAAAAFAVMSLSPSVLGLAAHATHFVALPVLAGLRLLLPGVRHHRGWSAVAGACFGLAVLMKQSGAAFLPLGLGLLLHRELSRGENRLKDAIRHTVLFSLAALLPYAATCGWLLHAGVFERFWFWTVTYAREYASILSLREGLEIFRRTIGDTMGPSAPLWILGGVGLVLSPWCARLRPWRWGCLGWALAAFAAVCPGFYFRSHYFIVALPVIAVAGGAAVSILSDAVSRRSWARPGRIGLLAVALGLLLFPLWARRDILFTLPPAMACRAVYGDNPFPESPEIARFIAEHSRPDATIAVIGSEPQIYFHAQRRSATGYIYTYGLMEPQPFALVMQREMIREITEAQPEFLVLIRISTSWLRRPDSHTEIFAWVQGYSQRHFEVVGAIDITSTGAAEYRWVGDRAPVSVWPDSPILILRRRSDHR